MKKLLVVLSVVLLVLVGAYGLGSKYKYELYDMAMAMEQNKAKLTPGVAMVGDLRFAYLEGPKVEGQPSLVLIHGFAANKENWMRFAANLTDQYHVIAVDLLGHGESTQDPKLSYDIDDQVLYLSRFLDAKKISNVHLAGNSMGGAVSSLFAATYPERVLTVSLVNPAGVFDHRSVLEDYLERGENPLVVKKPSDIYTLMDFAMVDVPFVPWPITEVVAERSMAKKALNDQIFEQIKGDHKYNFKQALTRIKAPTLVMWGKEDKVINYKNADLFNELVPNSTKLIYQDIGHAPMIEIPMRSAEDISKFIMENS
ncbi:alpha/beta hydrolase [Litoribacillus peritrichatus]|uniref:Alpha/beta fold hydrolase n=1 Tax=Litoribacillus peritrichatus TaxID=718191 RepID=A0ABP7M1R6_9GAMM